MYETKEAMKARENVQEWSKARLQQIQDLLNWELERLTNDLVFAHEQFLGLSSMRGPNLRQSSVPKITEAIEEAIEPNFDNSGTGSTGAKSEKPAEVVEFSTENLNRRSWRKMTPFLKPSDLADLQVSEDGSEASEASNSGSNATSPEFRGRTSRGSHNSNDTEGMECLSSGANSMNSQNQKPVLLQVITDMPDAESTPSAAWDGPDEGLVSESEVPAQSDFETKSHPSEFSRRTGKFVKQTRLSKIVTSKFFDTFYSVLIILNCVTMGLQADMLVNVRVQGDVLVNDYSPQVVEIVQVAEHILVSLFTIEITVRLRVFGISNYFDIRTAEGWFNFVDAIIVLLSGVVSGWIIPLFALITQTEMNGDFLSTLSVFRALRLLRIVRVIQRMPMFREVWLLLKGLTSSLRTLVWTVIVIFVLTYLFAILGCQTISREMLAQIPGKEEDELAKLLGVYDYVKGIAPLMQLLIQFLTLDSWNSKMDQIIPYANGCIIYFYMYIAVAVFVLMNLVTAIIVENAMSTSKMDENEKLKQMEDIKKKELKELEHLFYLMDADGDGTLDWEEFENAFLDEEMSRKWRLLDFGPDECKELFDLLDDGDGGIHTAEFFHGLARMKGGAQSRDLMRVGQQVDRIGKELDKLIEAWKTERRSNQIDSATASELGSRSRNDSGSEISDIFDKKKKRSAKSPKLGIDEARRRMAQSKAFGVPTHTSSVRSVEDRPNRMTSEGSVTGVSATGASGASGVSGASGSYYSEVSSAFLR